MSNGQQGSHTWVSVSIWSLWTHNTDNIYKKDISTFHIMYTYSILNIQYFENTNNYQNIDTCIQLPLQHIFPLHCGGMYGCGYVIIKFRKKRMNSKIAMEGGMKWSGNEWIHWMVGWMVGWLLGWAPDSMLSYIQYM